MKKLAICSLVISLVLGTYSCSNSLPAITADFEDVVLTDSILNSRSFTTSGLEFSNSYDTTYGSWEGFAVSARVNTTDKTYENQYSPITGEAFSGSNFAVVYQGIEVPTLRHTTPVNFRSLRITNGTYPYFAIYEGNQYSKKFADGDWFKIIITGYDDSDAPTGAVEVYLADFRNGKSFILNSWMPVDLSPIDECTSLKFTFDSTDKGDYGVNTPTYAIIDDIVYETTGVR